MTSTAGSVSGRAREKAADRLATVQRRLVGLRRDETAALRRYCEACAEDFVGSARGSGVEAAERDLERARRVVARAEDWRAQLL